MAENELVVVSIFVNPLQFAPHEDLAAYPRQLEQDRQICARLGVKILFAPPVAEMGISEGETTIVVPPSGMTSGLCGQYRPGHFQGVATIVTKLLNLVRPTTAYFGQKDAQQLAIIRRLVQDLHLKVTIASCPIVREDLGLAYSSRNQYLSPQQKQEASALYRSLSKAKQAFTSGERNAAQLLAIVQQELRQTPAIKLQYAQLVEPATLTPLTAIDKSGLLAIACYLGETRLIDNIILEVRKPIIAIDGPAGAGKSTISRRVAQSLGLIYLDTGAMYRAITWLVQEQEIEVEDEEAIASLVQKATLELLPAENLHSSTRVKINGRDVTDAIRTPEVTAKVSQIAAQAAVRQNLVKLQRQWGEKGGLVAEGRDIGTNVFPDAELKIFLTASVEERARRRLLDLKNQGEADINLPSLQQEIEQRDYLDSNRPLSPLKKADDAIEVNTDGLSIDQVTEQIISLYKTSHS
jgi:pantoate ligase/cytidylate kinase